MMHPLIVVMRTRSLALDVPSMSDHRQVLTVLSADFKNGTI